MDTFVFPGAFFSKASGKSGRSSQSVWLTKIAVGLICLLLPGVLAAAVMTQRIHRVEALLVAADLHPTCSFEHDCWIAVPSAAEANSSTGVSEVRDDALAPAPVQSSVQSRDERRDETASSSGSPSFGALVTPMSGWSGPDVAPKKVRSSLQGSARRLSVAMEKASARLKPSETQTRPQQSTSNRKTSVPQHTAKLQPTTSALSN